MGLFKLISPKGMDWQITKFTKKINDLKRIKKKRPQQLSPNDAE
jgi:hypothetical protein